MENICLYLKRLKKAKNELLQNMLILGAGFNKMLNSYVT